MLTLFLVARSLTIVSMMGGLLVGDHLAWRHGAKYILLALHLEGVVVRLAVVDDSSIKLPLASKEKVANGHWNDITLQGVFVGTNYEGDLYSMLTWIVSESLSHCTLYGCGCFVLGNWSLEQSSALARL